MRNTIGIIGAIGGTGITGVLPCTLSSPLIINLENPLNFKLKLAKSFAKVPSEVKVVCLPW